MSSAMPVPLPEGEDERFTQALRKVVTTDERERYGIGMQKEKTVHAVLKYFEEPDEDCHEIPIGNYIADIYRDGQIIEIQTAQFYRMREKLSAFLPEYRVRIVHPIPYEKYITWIDPVTGKCGKRNRSPRRGSFYQAFQELYRIRSFLSDPNLSIELLLIDMEEYRLQDGWDRTGKRGSHRYDRIPVRIRESCFLTSPRDYMQLVPLDLPDTFTSADFARAAGCAKARVSTVMLLLTEMKVLERIGKKGRSYLYRVAESG